MMKCLLQFPHITIMMNHLKYLLIYIEGDEPPPIKPSGGEYSVLQREERNISINNNYIN